MIELVKALGVLLGVCLGVWAGLSNGPGSGFLIGIVVWAGTIFGVDKTVDAVAYFWRLLKRVGAAAAARYEPDASRREYP